MIAVDILTMKNLEKAATDDYGIPSIILMENAACGFVLALEKETGSLKGKNICVVCGRGNNGGDGYAIARLMHLKDANVDIFPLCDVSTLSGDAKTNMERAKKMGIPFIDSFKYNYDIVIDAIFGTGFHGEVEGSAKYAIEYMNESGSYIASVDVPSGVIADIGQVCKTYVNANLLVTFGYAKIGLFLYPARSSYKKLIVSPISIPKKSAYSYDIITKDSFSLLPERKGNSHKGTFGKALAFVGSSGMAGAAILAGSAILKSGTGMVTVATAENIISTLAHRFPSVMTLPLHQDNGEFPDTTAKLLLEKSKDSDAVLIGCGLGKSSSTCQAVIELINFLEKPLVIDADALNILSKNIDILNRLNKNIILTPHIAEFSRLSGVEISKIKENPILHASDFAKKYNVTLILKDAVTVVADALGKVSVCPASNSGMATAGSGDVLAGIVTGFLSQGLSPFCAATAGVYAHSAAGNIARELLGERGMTSEDILNCVPKALMSPCDISPDIKEL